MEQVNSTSESGSKPAPPTSLLSPSSNSKYSLLLYEKRGTPRYFEVQKSTLRLIFFIIPAVCFFLLSLSIFSLKKYLKYKQHDRLISPAMFEQFKAERKSLQDDIKDLKSLNTELQEKLTSIQQSKNDGMPEIAITPTGNSETAPVNSSQNIFDVFTPIQGMKDFSANPVFTLEDPEVVLIKEKIHFRFNIVNQTKDNQKYAGHVFVIFKDAGAFYIYPSEAMASDNFKVQFNAGESFATTRFRPVEATFKGYPQGEQGIFSVIIFSRTGDIIHKQTFVKKLRP